MKIVNRQTEGSCSFGNDFVRNVVIFEVDNSSLSHSDNRKSNFLVSDEGSTSDINNSFGSLATTCMSLNSEQCKIRPTLIGLNPVELNYYLFMIALDKCNGSCSTLNEISDRICVETK